MQPCIFPVPEAFTGDDDVWELEEPLLIVVLNAWIWRRNPHGTSHSSIHALREWALRPSALVSDAAQPRLCHRKRDIT